MTMRVPFTCSDADVEAYAADNGVIFCPVRWFGTGDRDQDDVIRLSFSDLRDG